jgi:hypothetical protein
LTKKVSIVEKEKYTILKELEKSRWLESKVALATKKVYEDKVRLVIDENVDSKLISVLITEARRKQGNQHLNWGNWLKIPENKYLFQVNEDIARKVFEDTNALIPTKRRRGSSAEIKNYSLTFTGSDKDGSRADLVSTQFMPNDPDGSGKHLAESGFTVAYWFRPDQTYGDSFHISWKAHTNARFEFGVKDVDQPYFGTGPSNRSVTTSWENMLSNSDNEDLKSTFLDDSYNILKDGTWMHIAVTYVGTDNPDGDGNMLRKIYVNGTHIYGGFGETRESVNWTRTADDLAHGVAFGMRAVLASGTDSETGRGNVKYNNGQACGLDEVAIYKEAKDADWVSTVFNSGTPVDLTGDSGLVGYWRFNEGTGTRVEDLSGYGHHGTLTNASHGTAIDNAINNIPPSGTPTWSTDTP